MHEFGHLQMFPFEVLYAVLLVSVSIINGHTQFYEIILVLISLFAMWEIFAETYAILRKDNCYSLYYKGVSLIPRIIFWTGTSTLVSIGWIIALR